MAQVLEEQLVGQVEALVALLVDDRVQHAAGWRLRGQVPDGYAAVIAPARQDACIRACLMLRDSCWQPPTGRTRLEPGTLWWGGLPGGWPAWQDGKHVRQPQGRWLGATLLSPK